MATTKGEKAKKAELKAATAILAKPIAEPRNQDEKLVRIAAATVVHKGVAVADAEGTARKVKLAPCLHGCPEGAVKDALNGRIGSRTQVIHSILIDAAKRGVIITTQGIQNALEMYLGEGHGAAYAHLNTLNGKGSSASHPCKTTPYVHHNDEQVPDGWGLTYYACKLAGIAEKEMPAWVVKPTAKKK